MNMEILIIGLIIVSSFILLLKNFNLGIKVLLVLSTLLHKEVFSIYEWDFLPVRFFMLSLGIFLVYDVFKTYLKEKSIKKYLSILKDPLVLILILLWLVRAASIIFSKNLTASIQLLAFFTTVVALGILLYKNFYEKEDKLLDLIKFYIKVTLVLTFFGLFQLFLYTKYEFIIGALWNVPGHIPRIGSTFWDVNHFASLLACLLPVIGVLILVEKGVKKKLGYIATFGLMTGMLLLTSSRTSWIIALVSFLTFVVLFLIRQFGKKGIYGLLLAILLILIPAVKEYSIKSSPFRAYIKDNFHYRLDSFASHLMLIEGSFQIFEEYPVLGGGYGGFFEHFSRTDVSAEFFGRDPAALNTRVPAHTIWGEAMAETGLVGLSLVVLSVFVLLGVPLYGAFKAEDKKDKLILSAIFSTLLGVFIAGIFYSYNAEYFWLVLFIYYLYSLSVVRKNSNLRHVFEHFTGSSKFYLFLIIVFSFALIFSKLGINHLIPWDEAIYAKIAKNMVVRDEFINMYWRSSDIWFEKPPLMMWLMAGFMKLLGFSSLAARLPSAILGFGTVILVYLMSKKFFGKFAAYFSALSLVTGIHYLYYSRAAMIDVATTFFITLSIYLFLIAKEKKKLHLYFLSGLVTGLGVMAKGVIGFLPLLIMGAYDLYLLIFKIDKDWKALIRPYIYLISSTLLVALPWHFVMYARYGKAFIDNYLIYHVFNRAAQAIEDKGQPFFWYAMVMRVSMRVWFISFVGALPIFIVRAFRKEKIYALFLGWFSIVFLLFSASSSKLVWYIIPLYPAVAIMSGVFIDEAYKAISERFTKLKDANITFMFIFLATIVFFAYLFSIRGMVYTSDLTGAEAKLMKLKDIKLGTETMFYIDRVPLPLVLYYTDGPYRIIDFEPSKGRAPIRTYDKRIIILGKSGRFVENIPQYKEPTILDEEGDYILWYYESDLNEDKEELKDVREEISKLKKESTTSLELSRLRVQEQELISRISVFEDIE
ncbi:glycosyltransferase family 39 protein [Patescibacteria group bacterium]